MAYPWILRDLACAGAAGIVLELTPVIRQQIDLCRRWGFRIKEEDGGRFRLEYDQEQLVPLWVERETPALAWDRTVAMAFLSVSSTNTEAMALAQRGAPQGTLVYAEEQTAGKGRRNRIWFSPAGSGLYFSIVLRPKQLREKWTLITHAASVALVEVLKDLTDWRSHVRPLRIELKWPNDVLLSSKKCAGILLEVASFNDQSAVAVVGIGINVHAVCFPPSLAIEATSIEEVVQTPIPRRKLLVDFLDRFQKWYLLFEQGRYREVIGAWQTYCPMANNVKVLISDGIETKSGISRGITEDGALLVRTDDGRLETVFAGDVSVRKSGKTKS